MTADVLERQTLGLESPLAAGLACDDRALRALVMLWNESARVIEPDDYRLLPLGGMVPLLEPVPGAPCIRTSRTRPRVPEVICLTHYERAPIDRRGVQPAERGGSETITPAQYCGEQPGWEQVTIDHGFLCLARKEASRTGPNLCRGLRRVQRHQGRPAPRNRPGCVSAVARRDRTGKPFYAAHQGIRVPSWTPVRRGTGRWRGVDFLIDEGPTPAVGQGRGQQQGRPPGRGLRLQPGRTGFESLRPCWKTRLRMFGYRRPLVDPPHFRLFHHSLTSWRRWKLRLRPVSSTLSYSSMFFSICWRSSSSMNQFSVSTFCVDRPAGRVSQLKMIFGRNLRRRR